jgi:uncharacterized protein
LIVFDFSFPKAVIERLVGQGTRLEIHDHHESARRDIEGFPFCHFDMDKSGARLAWEYFFPLLDPPQWLLYVEDRDLWRFKYDQTIAFSTHVSFSACSRQTRSDHLT